MKIFTKKPSSLFNYIVREWPQNIPHPHPTRHPILRNLHNFPPGAFFENERECGWKQINILHFVYKRYFDEKSTSLFRQKLHKVTWDNINNIKEPDEAYRKFSVLYTKVFFPKK